MVLGAQQYMGSSWIRDQTCVSCVSRQILYHWATREAQDSTSLTSFQVLPMWTTKYTFEYKILALVKLKFCDSISRESLPEAHGPSGCTGTFFALGALHHSHLCACFCSVIKSCLTLQTHGLQNARPPCPSPWIPWTSVLLLLLSRFSRFWFCVTP